MIIHRGDIDSSALGDGANRGAVKTLFSEDLTGGAENFVARIFLGGFNGWLFSCLDGHARILNICLKQSSKTFVSYQCLSFAFYLL